MARNRECAASLQVRSGEAERARLSIDHRPSTIVRRPGWRLVKWQNAAGDGRPPMARGAWSSQATGSLARIFGASRGSLDSRAGFQADGVCRLESSVMGVSGISTSVEGGLLVIDRHRSMPWRLFRGKASIPPRWWCRGLVHSRRRLLGREAEKLRWTGRGVTG